MRRGQHNALDRDTLTVIPLSLAVSGQCFSDPRRAYNHMIVVEWATIKTWNALARKTRIYIPETHSKVVVKLFSRFISGGCADPVTQLKLLNAKSEILTHVKEYYLVFLRPTTGLYNPFFVSITKLIRGFLVSDPQFLIMKKSQQEVKQLFFDDVYHVAMETVEHNVLHWDIWPENVIFDESRNHPIVID